MPALPSGHLAHTTWFWETFFCCATHVPGYRLAQEDWPFLFNSYYETEGARNFRARRAPGCVFATRRSTRCSNGGGMIDEAMTPLLDDPALGDLHRARGGARAAAHRIAADRYQARAVPEPRSARRYGTGHPAARRISCTRSAGTNIPAGFALVWPMPSVDLVLPSDHMKAPSLTALLLCV